LTERAAPLVSEPASTASSIRRLGRNTLIYSAGIFAQRIISIIMLPVYTRVMTPADYGVLDLLQMVTDVAALLLTAGLTAGVQRFYFQSNDQRERNELVSTAFLMQFGLGVLGTIGMLLFAEPIARHALGGGGTATMVRISSLNFSLGVLSTFPRLAERLDHGGWQLSGGEQQMLTIGRALMTNPDLLILDEATEGLAPQIAKEIWRIIDDIRARGIATLIVDKNYRAVTAIADRNVILVKGRVVFEGDSRTLLAQPDVLHRHLGV